MHTRDKYTGISYSKRKFKPLMLELLLESSISRPITTETRPADHRFFWSVRPDVFANVLSFELYIPFSARFRNFCAFPVLYLISVTEQFCWQMCFTKYSQFLPSNFIFLLFIFVYVYFVYFCLHSQQFGCHICACSQFKNMTSLIIINSAQLFRLPVHVIEVTILNGLLWDYFY